MGFLPVPVARSLRAFRRSCGGGWWLPLVAVGFCGGALWLRFLSFRLALSSCRVARWFRRCPRPGGARSSVRRWLPARVAGASGRRAGRFPVPWSWLVSRCLRLRRPSRRRGRAGSASRWPFGGSPAATARCSGFRCRWPCRLRSGLPLPLCFPLRLAGCGLRWLGVSLARRRCRRCRCWSPAGRGAARAGWCAARAAFWRCAVCRLRWSGCSAVALGCLGCRRFGFLRVSCCCLPFGLRRCQRSRCVFPGRLCCRLRLRCLVCRCQCCRVAVGRSR